MFRLPSEDLVTQIDDPEFAHPYLEDQANLRIAAQVRALRMQRGWTQHDLAEKSGIKQSRISKIEGADFESLTLLTMRKLAQAFDVHARVTFTSVGDALIDFANLSKERLEVASRDASLAKIEALRASDQFVATTSQAPMANYVGRAASTASVNSYAPKVAA